MFCVCCSCISNTFALSFHNLFFRHSESVAKTPDIKIQVMRNVSIIELLFSTGIRVSELCSLMPDRIDFETGRILIRGKGNKERIVYIGLMHSNPLPPQIHHYKSQTSCSPVHLQKPPETEHPFQANYLQYAHQM